MRALLLLFMMQLAAPLHAQLSSTVEASAHHRRGVLHFELGQYKEAASEFTLAYSVEGTPPLLFNLAQAQRLSGERALALASYRAYLKADPAAANRAEVEGLVDELAAPPHSAPGVVVPRAPRRVTTVTPLGAVAPPASRPRVPLARAWWLWTTVAATAVIGGVVLGVTLAPGRSPSLGVLDARR